MILAQSLQRSVQSCQKMVCSSTIVHPSEGIGFGYEGWEIKMKDGSVLTGIIASKTETDIDLKFPGGATSILKQAMLDQ